MVTGIYLEVDQKETANKTGFFFKMKKKIRKEEGIKKIDPNLSSVPPVSACTFVLMASGAFLSVAITAGECKRDPDPRVPRPPGFDCVSLSCVAGFLILYWVITGSGCSPKC